MKNWTVYFEMYGRKMKTTVFAKGEQQAKEIILEKVIFHKIEQAKGDAFNQASDAFDNLINILKPKS